MSDLKEVWTVDLHDHTLDDQGKTIMVVSTREEAIRRAKAMNNRYAYGVILEEDGTLAECEENDRVIYNDGIDFQYYDVGSFNVDETFYLDVEECHD